MTTAELVLPAADAEVGAVHMIRADLDIREFHRWAGSRGLIIRSAFDEGFAMHCLLTESFGELAPKPFRVIIPRGRGRAYGCLYGYAHADADALCAAASLYADPLQSLILPASRIDSKPIPTAWRAGQRLGFETLVRPIVRRARGADRPGREADAFQAEAELHDKGCMRRTREDVYKDWLKKRLQANGASQLEEASLAMFQRVRTVRKLHARASEGPHAVMRGSLMVTDASAFSRMLAQGIGRHKAYGYGMLLLRPVRT